MKIQVRHSDGRIEILSFVGPVQVSEPSVDGGLGCVYLPAVGTRHFFAADGSYDGLEMEMAGGENGAIEGDPMDFIRKFASGVDGEREFLDERTP